MPAARTAGRCDRYKWNPWQLPARRIPLSSPVRGQKLRRRTRPRRRGTYPVGSSVSAHAPPTRSILKMKRVDPAHPCISATMGVVMSNCLWGMVDIGNEVWPRAYCWISSEVVAPSTRRVPPLTESPGRGRVCERGRTGSLKRQTQPRAAENRVLKGWREQRLGIRCRPGALLFVARFKERPAMNAGKATRTCTTK